MEDMCAFVSPDARPSSATNRLGDNPCPIWRTGVRRTLGLGDWAWWALNLISV